MEEIWRNIEGYEGLYQVSNTGKVRNTKTGKIFKTQIEHCGYEYVILHKGKKEKLCLIHRLVALAFVPNPNNYPCVNHKDECKTNNVYTNLEWVDHKTNCNYGTRNKKISRAHCKPIYQYSIDGTFIKEWNSINAAANYYNISSQRLSHCVNGRSKTSYGYVWKYAKEKEVAA